MVLRLVIVFIARLNLVPINNYGAIVNSYTQQFTTAHAKLHSPVSSLVIA